MIRQVFKILFIEKIVDEYNNYTVTSFNMWTKINILQISFAKFFQFQNNNCKIWNILLSKIIVFSIYFSFTIADLSEYVFATRADEQNIFQFRILLVDLGLGLISGISGPFREEEREWERTLPVSSMMGWQRYGECYAISDVVK